MNAEGSGLESRAHIWDVQKLRATIQTGTSPLATASDPTGGLQKIRDVLMQQGKRVRLFDRESKVARLPIWPFDHDTMNTIVCASGLPNSGQS